jgi:ectoine hydroxylase-related dioxygenase (phytanoyl-CoA dioxygenase family)
MIEMDTKFEGALGHRLDQDGFYIVPGVFSLEETTELIGLLPTLGDRAGTRSLLDHRVGQICANDSRVRNLVELALGSDAQAVRGILFDKTPQTNWTLGWHQDTKIAVGEQKDAPGYSAWSVKEGVIHCQPPVDVLEQCVAVRIHLDDCDEVNGPLQVIPGSHRSGISNVTDFAEATSLTCRAGDVILMKPLTWHASSKSEAPRHGRVIHIEFSAAALQGGLRWAT